VHRTLVSLVLAAAGVGAGVGWFVHSAASRQHGTIAALGVLAAGLLSLWVLSWIGTLRLARPLVRLARVARDLRHGQLSRRDAIETSRDEVGEVAGALRHVSDRVAQQLADQRSLLGAVSPALRSPLSRMRILVALDREGRAPEDVHDALQEEVQGMDHLVADLLTAARIDFEAVSPVAIDTVDAARRATADAHLSPDLVHADALTAPAVADATLLAWALRTLLDNAQRHGGDVVGVHIATSNDLITLAVEDSGRGFAPGEEEAAFAPFWRRAGEGRDGVGLGLSLVRRIAEAHGGTAGAENRPDGGARVWLRLPVDDDGTDRQQ